MDLTGQWADSLLTLERLHFLKLVVWGALSVLGGSGVIAGLLIRRVDSPLLRRFAQVTLIGGVIVSVIGLAMRASAELRDLHGAIALDRWLWFGIGLNVGLVLLGVTLALFCGWRAGAQRRLGIAGVGIALVVQGLALAVLALQLTAGLVR